MDERLAHTDAGWHSSSDEVRIRPVLSFEEWASRVNAAPPPTPDDVTILKDGRRLDTPEKVIAWVHELAAERASEQAVDDGRS